MQPTEVQAGDNLPLEPPDKVTILWLLKHVPVTLCVAFFTLLLASFSFGVKTSHILLVRDLYGLKKTQSLEENAPSKSKPNKPIQQTPKSDAADG